jgi:acyl-CoA thioester hydrolase
VEPPGKPAPENAFLRELQVAPSDQDVLGHVNHARYLDFVEDTRCFAAHAGAFGDDLSGAQKSARRIAVDYDQEATFGERLQILTWAAPGTGVFNVQIRRASDGSVVTRAQVSMT